MTESQKFLSDVIVYLKYAKYLPEENRKETWEEIVDRNKNMHIVQLSKLCEDVIYDNGSEIPVPYFYRAKLTNALNWAYQYVYEKKILPSMRSLQFGGNPIHKHNTRIYNCSWMPIDDIAAFSEAMYLLLSGCGVGYSVQKRHINSLPTIKRAGVPMKYIATDSIEGWANCVKVLMEAYLLGNFTPVFDFSDIRPKGAPISAGSKAPGPKQLAVTLYEIEKILKGIPIGKKLDSLSVHKIMCIISQAVLSGGIRRAAMICLFDKDDVSMAGCKGKYRAEYIGQEEGKDVVVVSRYPNVAIDKGYINASKEKVVLENNLSEYDLNVIKETGLIEWYHPYPYLGMSNNSAYLHRDSTTKEEFDAIWDIGVQAGSGEPAHMWFETRYSDYGTNPCAEVSLRACSFCNLVEVNISDIEDSKEFYNRVKAATIIATYQATYTDFTYLRPIWKINTEKDALIGVGLTGFAKFNTELDFKEAAKLVTTTNRQVAKMLGINAAARTRVVKPSGTASLVLGCSNGIHPYYNSTFIKTVRVNENEAIAHYMRINFPELIEKAVTEPNTYVISFPIKVDSDVATREEGPIAFLDRVMKINREWINGDNASTGKEKSNNVSATVSIPEGQWDEVRDYLWEVRKEYRGMSFLAYSGGTYRQAPLQDITEEKYNEMIEKFKGFDITKVVDLSNNTNFGDTLACAGGACEL